MRDVGEGLVGGGFGAVTSAVEGDEGVLGEGGFADGAVLGGVGGVVHFEPFVDAGPAVEVAAESDDGIYCEV